MTFLEFIKDRYKQIFLHLIAAAGLAVFLKATGTSGGVVLIILIVWAVGLLIILAGGYIAAKSRLDSLEAIMDGLEQRYIYAECIPKGGSLYEQRLNDLMRRAGKAMIEAVSQAEEQQKEYREYIEDWVHEIKVPITAAQLMCRNHKSEFSNKMVPQLVQVEEHVERALYYARLGGVEKDFIIRAARLEELVAEVISRQQSLLIQSGIRIETEHLERVVYTDVKWAGFLLGQILSNAVRYRSESPLIRITAGELGKMVRLEIVDNGIGISDYELPRIFDRGFTGSNGRNRGGATGMGLYICKKLAVFLHIDIQIESAENEYTRVSLVFPAKENLT